MTYSQILQTAQEIDGGNLIFKKISTFASAGEEIFNVLIQFWEDCDGCDICDGCISNIILSYLMALSRVKQSK